MNYKLSCVLCIAATLVVRETEIPILVLSLYNWCICGDITYRNLSHLHKMGSQDMIMWEGGTRGRLLIHMRNSPTTVRTTYWAAFSSSFYATYLYLGFHTSQCLRVALLLLQRTEVQIPAPVLVVPHLWLLILWSDVLFWPVEAFTGMDTHIQINNKWLNKWTIKNIATWG